MKKLLNYLEIFFSQERYFYGIFIIFIILLGQLPIILHIFRAPAGFYYPLLDRTSFSDYYYLGIIKYGMGSEWMLKIPYVTYEHQASLIQIFFVVLGKISLLTKIGPAEIFALFRVLGGVIYSVAVAIFFKTILPKKGARIAFLIFLFAQPFAALDILSRTSNDLDNWVWHFGEAARKISAQPPHYTFGKGLTILSLVFLLRGLKKRFVSNSSTPGESLYASYPRGVFIIVACLLVFLAGIIYPPPVFIMVFSLIITGVIIVASAFGSGEIFSETFGYLSSFFRKISPLLIFYFFIAFLPLILLRLELAKGYPWDMWNKVELGWNTRSMQFEWWYMRMLGVLLPFVILSVLWGLWRRVRTLGYSGIFISVWFISSFLLFPFADFLNLGKFRFIEGAQIVPLSVLAFWGFELIRNNKLKIALACLYIVNFIVFALLQLRWSTLRLWPLWTNVYFRPQEVEAFNFLNLNARKDGVIATDAFASNYLPAMARVRTILGFPDFYPKAGDFVNDEKDILNILNGRMKEKEVREFLEKRKIDYVYADLSKYPKKDLYPNTLTVVYQNELFMLYKVKR